MCKKRLNILNKEHNSPIFFNIIIIFYTRVIQVKKREKKQERARIDINKVKVTLKK
jgi:hypothetical protein